MWQAVEFLKPQRRDIDAISHRIYTHETHYLDAVLTRDVTYPPEGYWPGQIKRHRPVTPMLTGTLVDGFGHPPSPLEEVRGPAASLEESSGCRSCNDDSHDHDVSSSSSWAAGIPKAMNRHPVRYRLHTPTSATALEACQQLQLWGHQGPYA